MAQVTDIIGSILDFTDTTKRFSVDFSGASPGSTLTIVSTTVAPNETITLPSGNNTLVSTTSAQVLTNKTLTDANTFFQNEADPTKQFVFQLSSISVGTTRTLTIPDVSDTLVTLGATQTLTNKTLTAPAISSIVNTGTLTLPTSTDTLIGRNTTDTLTNKTITDTTNTISASQLRTTGSDVVISSATAPIAGQVLTASSPTTADWQTPTTSGAAGGDLTGTYPNPSLINSGVTAGTYQSPEIAINAKGIITAVSERVKTVNMTNADFIALNGTPFVVLPAPGPGLAYWVHAFCILRIYGGTPLTAGSNIILAYGNTANNALGAGIISATQLTGNNVDTIAWCVKTGNTGTATSLCANTDINLRFSGTAFTGGTDSIYRVTVFYMTVPTV